MMKAITKLTGLLLSMPLAAQAIDGEDLLELSLDALINIEISTASKTEEKSSVAPAVVTVITAEDIATYGYASVADALAHVAGFVNSSDLVRDNFGVRGIHAGQGAGSRIIKFMLNNQPIAFRTTQQQWLDMVAMNLIERIEVVRGPASALYGANAFAGVVNIITRDAAYFTEHGQHLSLSAGHTEAAGNQGQMSLAGGLSHGDWRLSGGLTLAHAERGGLSLPRSSPQYDLFAAGTGGRVTQVDDNTAQPFSAYAQAHWQPNAQRQISLSGHYQVLDADQPFADLSPLRDTGFSHEAQGNGFMRADWQENWSDSLSSRVFLAYANGKTLDDDRIEVGASDYYLRRNLGYSAYDGGLEWLWRRGDDTLLAGVDFSRDNYDLATFSRIGRTSGMVSALNSPRRENFSNTGIYWQWQHPFAAEYLHSRWRSTLGYRYDKHSYTGGQSSFRAGLVAELPQGRVLKFLIGSAFQAPSPELLFREAVQGGDIVGNPELAPQKAATAELHLATPLGQAVHLNATLFYTRISDLVLYESTLNNFIARNSTQSDTTGLELELRYRRGNWQGYLNAALQDTQVDDNPYNLFVLNEREHGSLYPRFSANLGFSYAIPAYKLRLSVDNRYVGKRPAATPNVLIAQRFYELDSYLDSSVTLSWALSQRSRVRFQVQDLFDSSYLNPGFSGIDIPSLGRRYRLTWEMRF